MQKARDLEWIVVGTEVEALVLECNLIKKYRPPYNVRMRDDKSYPYITITDEEFPRVMFTRRVRKDKARYFGPYTSAFAVRDTLGLLHKIFPLIPCGKSWSGAPVQRPCLYYHLGRCLGPCAGLSDRKEYQGVLDKVGAFLDGKEDTIMEGLMAEMAAAAEALDFEKAAKVRDQVKAIEQRDATPAGGDGQGRGPGRDRGGEGRARGGDPDAVHPGRQAHRSAAVHAGRGGGRGAGRGGAGVREAVLLRRAGGAAGDPAAGGDRGAAGGPVSGCVSGRGRR